jgi:type 1 glutamine amidotransferase
MRILRLPGLLALSLICVSVYSQKNSVLIFGKTVTYYHTSIPRGMLLLKTDLEKEGIVADTTRDATVFTPENLKKYKAVVFMNTTGNVLNEEQEAALYKYIMKGGGYVGVHAATDTEYDWPFYGKLSGAYFKTHPQQQDAIIRVTDKTHPATSFLPADWKRNDEWYDFKGLSQDMHVLAFLDESSYQGGSMGKNHPFIWYQYIGKGRSFYTGVGHRDDNFEEPLVRKHLTEAVKWSAKIIK